MDLMIVMMPWPEDVVGLTEMRRLEAEPAGCYAVGLSQVSW